MYYPKKLLRSKLVTQACLKYKYMTPQQQKIVHAACYVTGAVIGTSTVAAVYALGKNSNNEENTEVCDF